jgi:hypothetical protein
MSEQLKELIKNSTKRFNKRVYIKRRKLDGTYEDNWQRVDIIGGLITAKEIM